MEQLRHHGRRRRRQRLEAQLAVLLSVDAVQLRHVHDNVSFVRHGLHFRFEVAHLEIPLPKANAAKRGTSFVVVVALVAMVDGCGGSDTPQSPPDVTTTIATLAHAQRLQQGTFDSDLVGTWTAEDARFTATGYVKGQVVMQVWPQGQYVSIFKGDGGFAIEPGWLAADDGAWKTRPLVGGENLASYTLSGDTLTVSSPYASPVTWQRTTRDARIEQAEAMLQTPPTPTASDWALRGLQWARMWEPDAELFAVQVRDPTPDGYVGHESQLFLDYHSTSTHARLSVSPGPVGTVITGVFPGDKGLGGAMDPVPVPILDLVDIVNAARIAKEKSHYGSAMLSVERTVEGNRLVWSMTPLDPRLGEHVCFDVPKSQFFDCRTIYGDQAADYERLAARAAAAMQSLLHRGSVASGDGSAPTGSLSGGSVDTTPGAPAWDGGAAYRQSSAESAAYWSGDPDAYNRVLNHECNSSDSARFGC
jgi:hypothetical protein